MSQVIVAYFASNGTPSTGLSPTIDIYQVSDNSQLITAASMTEIAAGWYKYTYSTYDADTDIVFRCDGTNTLSDPDRYKFGANDDPQQVGIKSVEMRKALLNNMELSKDTSVLKIFENDGTTTFKSYDITDKDGNATGTNEPYKREVI